MIQSLSNELLEETERNPKTRPEDVLSPIVVGQDDSDV